MSDHRDERDDEDEDEDEGFGDEDPADAVDKEADG